MNEKITALKHRLNKIESLKDYQVELQQRIDENDAKLMIAYEILKKENKDVDKLKKASLSNVIAWFSHDKEERLAKEEREALQASIQVKQLQEEAEVLQRKLEECIQEIEQEDAIKEALYRLQLEDTMQGEHGEQAKAYYQRLEKEQLMEKELMEAIEAGYVVIDQLKVIVKEMENASTWGTIDMFGGGMMSSMIKHSHIDSAQKKIAELSENLHRFQKEVNDVKQVELPDVSIEGWLSGADIFFDNMIFDFMAQSKIDKNLKALRNCLSTITTLQDQLLSEQYDCVNRQNELKQALDKL